MKTYRIYVMTALSILLLLSLFLIFNRDLFLTYDSIIPDFTVNMASDVEETGYISVSDNDYSDEMYISSSVKTDYSSWQTQYDPVYSVLKVRCNSFLIKDTGDLEQYVDSLNIYYDAEKIEYCRYYIENGALTLSVRFADTLYYYGSETSDDGRFVSAFCNYDEIDGPITVIEPLVSDATEQFYANTGCDEAASLQIIADKFKQKCDGIVGTVIVLPCRACDAEYETQMIAFTDEINADLFIRLEYNDPQTAGSACTMAFYNEDYYTPELDGLTLSDVLVRNYVISTGGEALGVFGAEDNSIISSMNTVSADIRMGRVLSEAGKYNLNEAVYSDYAAEGLFNAVYGLFEQ